MFSQKIKAAIVEKFGKPVAIKYIPILNPGPGHVLLRVYAIGVCHTDLHAALGDWPVKPLLPLIPGHEMVRKKPYWGWMLPF
jgi:alcohol dehydrogenase, propanol-preferring